MNLELESRELLTVKEMADKLGQNEKTMYRHLKESGIEPAGTKIGDGGRRVSAYSLEQYQFLKEEEMRNKIEVARRTDTVVGSLIKDNKLGLVIQSTVQRMDMQQTAALASALICKLNNEVELLNVQNNELEVKVAELEKENKLMLDEHETFWTWLRFISYYKDEIAYTDINGEAVTFGECRTWRIKELKRYDCWLSDFCANKKIKVVGTKYDTQLAFDVNDMREYFCICDY